MTKKRHKVAHSNFPLGVSPRVGKAIHLQIDTKAFKEHCSQLDSFAKDLMATAYVKALIAEKEAGL